MVYEGYNNYYELAILLFWVYDECVTDLCDISNLSHLY